MLGMEVSYAAKSFDRSCQRAFAVCASDNGSYSCASGHLLCIVYVRDTKKHMLNSKAAL